MKNIIYVATFVMLFLMACTTSSTNNDTNTSDTISVVYDSVAVAENNGDVVRDLKANEHLSFNGLARPMVIDFWATWCGPCMEFKPTFHSLSGKYANKIDFVAVNVDECEEITNTNNVQAIPTLLLVNTDGSVERHEGLMSQEEFEKFLASAH